MESTFSHTWNASLARLLAYYEHKRDSTRYFFLKLFGIFVALNIVCYWWAMATAFPELTFGERGWHYFKMQVPVGILSALFELFSFFVTIYLVRHALRSVSTLSCVFHLSMDIVIDLFIGALATVWTIYVFTVSGWLIALTEPQEPPMKLEYSQRDESAISTSSSNATGSEQPLVPDRSLKGKKEYYHMLIIEALRNPGANWRNIYFGIVMGFSETIPTLLYLLFAARALAAHLAARRAPLTQ